MRHPHIDLINGVYCLMLDNLNCIRSWGLFLLSPEFDDEPELRNRISAIWLCSLLDSLEGELRALDGHKEKAEELGLAHITAACDEVGLFTQCVKEILA
ncbi:MAG: hypothetical protein RQ751_14590, partial [Longimicrobiales bacterium]|nr:hypothetical protein [Longimicrobiales bacterium]